MKPTPEMIEAALHARVPGGAEVWAWLPQKDAWTPHETARDVMQAALSAALSVPAAAVVGEPVAESEIIEALLANEPFVFDPATNFIHADDGGAPELGIKYVPAALSEPEGWRPIATAPKDGSKIDLWGINHLHYAKQGKRVVNVAWGPVRDWMGAERDDWQHGFGEDFEPTHWCPIPAPPALGGKP